MFVCGLLLVVHCLLCARLLFVAVPVVLIQRWGRKAVGTAGARCAPMQAILDVLSKEDAVDPCHRRGDSGLAWARGLFRASPN